MVKFTTLDDGDKIMLCKSLIGVYTFILCQLLSVSNFLTTNNFIYL